MEEPGQIYNYLKTFNVYLSPDYVIESIILKTGVWESHVVDLLKHFVKPGFMAVDVGANTGIHTLLLSDLVGPTGQVVAFEPSPDYSQRLMQNLSLNSNLKERVEVVREGVSNNTGDLKLFASGDKKGNSYMADEFDPNLWNTHDSSVYETCPVTTIDEKLHNRPVQLIKMDVEGMEHRVLAGASNVIFKNSPIIVYETLVEDFTEEKLLAAQQLLRAYGYFNFYLDPKLKRLLIAKYPALPEDCIAIHPRRMLSAAPLMHNCAQYEFSCPETIRIFGAPQQLTVIGVHKDLYCVALHPPHEDTMEMMLCERNEDTLSFVQTDNNTTRALHASAFVLPIDTEHAMHRDDTTIVVSSGGQTQKITGHLIDGVLYRY